MPTSRKQPLLSFFGLSPLSRFDGPGARVVVFFQGCPIACEWCHSPHSQPATAPLLFYPDHCRECGRCAASCPNMVHRFENGRHILHRDRCAGCGLCIAACPDSSLYSAASVLHLPTRTLPVSEVFTLICGHARLSDGVTLSGGEALWQADAAEALLTLLQEHGLHTAVETSGLLPPKVYERFKPLVDTWLFGARLVTDSSLKRHTGAVRAALQALTAHRRPDIIARIPMIPGVMDDRSVLQDTADILEEFGIDRVWLNPWNIHQSVYYHASGTPSAFPQPASGAIRQCEQALPAYFSMRGFSVVSPGTACARPR